MLLSLILLGLTCITVYASPTIQVRYTRAPITLPLAVHINATGGTVALVEADRARFARARADLRHTVIVPSVNSIVYYTCEVEIGSTSYTLLVDTGSSNTWVGAGKSYVVSSTSKYTNQTVRVTYGSGSFDGKEYTDMVTMGSAAIYAQSIGAASVAFGFQNVDGILGIGPVDLTFGTLFPNSTSVIPTVTDNMKAQGVIYHAQVGISFAPITGTTTPVANGQLDFGGMDPSKYIGNIDFVPVTAVQPAGQYWGITQGIMYGAHTSILGPSSAGIVDTGTTLLLLATDAFERYKRATGGVMDQTTGLLKITAEQYERLESLFFAIGRVTYEFTANAQIWPRQLNTAIGGVADAIYLVVADSGAESGSGLDFINGFVWLWVERFYTVYDTDNRRIGIGKTRHTRAKVN